LLNDYVNSYDDKRAAMSQSSFSKQEQLQSCTCRNHLNQTVDWFIIYKLPRLNTSENLNIKNGTGYMYLDSSSQISEWHLSPHSIKTNLSMAAITLNSLYENTASSYIYYSDQPPNQNFSLTFGHTKGVLAFDYTALNQ
ncbi:unnamed protein product, partial [Didymodactylos carnosus]